IHIGHIVAVFVKNLIWDYLVMIVAFRPYKRDKSFFGVAVFRVLYIAVIGHEIGNEKFLSRNFPDGFKAKRIDCQFFKIEKFFYAKTVDRLKIFFIETVLRVGFFISEFDTILRDNQKTGLDFF